MGKSIHNISKVCWVLLPCIEMLWLLLFQKITRLFLHIDHDACTIALWPGGETAMEVAADLERR